MCCKPCRRCLCSGERSVFDGVDDLERATASVCLASGVTAELASSRASTASPVSPSSVIGGAMCRPSLRAGSGDMAERIGPLVAEPRRVGSAADPEGIQYEDECACHPQAWVNVAGLMADT